MSIQTSSMHARHPSFVPVLPSSFRPGDFSPSAAQIELYLLVAHDDLVDCRILVHFPSTFTYSRFENSV